MTTVKAGYSCQTCKTEEFIQVRKREKSESIEHYMKAVVRCSAFDHGMRSPFCKAKTIDVKLPITKNGIGFDGPELDDDDKADLDRQLKK